MKNPRLIAIFTIATLCSMFTASAQQEGEPVSMKRSIRITTLGIPLNGVFYEAGNHQKVAIYATPGALTPPLPMPDGKFLQLFRELPVPAGAPPDTKPKRQDVGAFDLPAGPAIVVLLPPDDLAKEKIRGRAYQDSHQNHSSETARIFNLSPKEIAFRTGSQTIQLPVGVDGFIPWKAIAYNSTSYQIGTRGSKTRTWEVSLNGESAAPANFRFFVFVAEIVDTDGKLIMSSSLISDPMPRAVTQQSPTAVGPLVNHR